MLVYTVTAAPAVASDTVKRVLTITVNGELKSTEEYEPATTTFKELSAEENDLVVLTLVDVDNAGNPSAPAVCDFQATDTIPPPSPGEFGVSLAREE
jgi:hypothetical protein